MVKAAVILFISTGVKVVSRTSEDEPSAIDRAGRAWPVRFAAARLALGLVYLLLALFGPGASWVLWALPLAFSGAALALLFWSWRIPGTGALFGLFLDTICFLAFVRLAIDPGSWLDSAFYLYLLLAAVTLHRWKEVRLVVAVCAAFVAFLSFHGTEPLFGLVLFAGLLACLLAYQKHCAALRLLDLSREAAGLRTATALSLDAERQRIAGDFHDGPLQQFISLQMRLEVLRRMLERDPQAGLKDLADLQETATTQVRELRAFLRSLRPSEAPADGLAAGLRQAIAEFQKDSGIAASFQTSGQFAREPAEKTHEILQIVREALHNVQKHARATRVAVTASQTGSACQITIDDNGVGFPFSGTFNLGEMETLGIGPGSIKRRVRSLGGELVVESHPGRGAAMRIRIPE